MTRALLCLAWNENMSIMRSIGFHTSGEVITASFDSSDVLARARPLLSSGQLLLPGLPGGTATALGWVAIQ